MATPSDRRTADGASAARELTEQVRADLAELAYPAAGWTTRTAYAAATDYDVLVVGAGQSGLTSAIKLRREGVERILVVDRNAAGREGIWIDWARMRTLRTQKDLHGPDGGIPSASFRRWYTAIHGSDAWEALDLIPRETWMDYLVWIRSTFEVPVRNLTEVTDIREGAHGVAVRLHGPDGDSTVTARRVLVCTGLNGAGGAQLPSWIDALPPDAWAHSSHSIDFARLAGARVAVLGIGASGFDNAAMALEAGADVVQFGRQAAFSTVNAIRHLEHRGAFRHFTAVPDHLRVEVATRWLSISTPPPAHSVARCEAFDSYRLRMGSPWAGARFDGAGVIAELADGTEERFDFLIVATGFTVDLGRVPWLRGVVPHIVRWGDRVPVDDSPAGRRIAEYPYQTEDLALVPRDPEREWVSRIHLQNAASLVTMAASAVGINPLPITSDVAVYGITRALFAEQAREVAAEFLAATGSVPEPDVLRAR